MKNKLLLLLIPVSYFAFLVPVKKANNCNKETAACVMKCKQAPKKAVQKTSERKTNYELSPLPLIHSNI